MVFGWSTYSIVKAIGDSVYVVKAQIWDAWNRDTNALETTLLCSGEAQKLDRPKEAAVTAVTLVTFG